jgi:hypothetical protein
MWDQVKAELRHQRLGVGAEFSERPLVSFLLEAAYEEALARELETGSQSSMATVPAAKR